MGIGERIKQARELKRMTQEELGRLCKTTKQTIFKYESGTVTNIPLDRLERIAEALSVDPAFLIGWERSEELTPEGKHVGMLFDRADEKDKILAHGLLDKYDNDKKPVVVSTKKKNPGGFVELDVYDEPAAAGVGNYLSAPKSHREQFPAIYVPAGADYGVKISGDSMMPLVNDGSVVFVKSAVTVESGTIGIFILNGEAFCKQLVVDRKKKEVRLHSVNPAYKDIVIRPSDELRTVGRVL